MGSISHGTMRAEDLLEAFSSELEWQIRRNGDYFASPENLAQRDRLNNLVGEANDLYEDDGTILPDNEERAEEMVNESLPDALQGFCLPYFYFGSHPGDGSDFGYWCDLSYLQDAFEGFQSSKEQEYPADDYQGEWLHINERGNMTLYVRTNGEDKEVWGVV